MNQTETQIENKPEGRIRRIASTVRRYGKHVTILAIILGCSALGYAWWGRKSGNQSYTTAQATRGNVEVDVSATGTVQAVTTVQVGSQVSGTVSWLGADYKSNVKRGQVIAKLDPAIYQAQVDSARANLTNAEAAVKTASADIPNQTSNVAGTVANQLALKAQRDDAIALAKQDEKLKGIITDREIEAAQAAAQVAIAKYDQATAQIGQSQAGVQGSKGKVDQAMAAVEQAKAQLEQANVNLQHTIITSPIDGVVVSRNVDVGQTVQASLQAPTLFTIANDLTNMQVLASVDEADVGQIKEGGNANFAVDAYPGKTFSGRIAQLRLNAQSLQNVVTYTAVINTANPDLKLLPGMTANITIPVAQTDNVLTVPNAALRFKPALATGQQQPAAPANAQKTGTGTGGQRSGQGQGGAQKSSSNKAASSDGNKASSNDARAQQVVWVLAATNKLEQRSVTTGLTDGRVTAVVGGDLNEGDTVVTGETDASSAASRPSQATSPLGQKPGGGGAPRIR
jgi:HlyD family secretion protein